MQGLSYPGIKFILLTEIQVITQPLDVIIMISGFYASLRNKSDVRPLGDCLESGGS